MKKLHIFLFIWMLLSVNIMAQAQGVVVTAYAGDPPILMRYVLGREETARQYVEAIQRAKAVYNPLWSQDTTPFKIFLDLVGDPAEGEYAMTQLETISLPATTDMTDAATLGLAGRQEVCRIRVYNSPEFANEPSTRHNAAHELVHCYQKSLISEGALMSLSFESPQVGLWWFEGSAEWMASLVYPARDSFIAGETITNFLQDVRQKKSFFEFDYTAKYFWHYLAAHADPSLIMNLLKNMPASAGYIPYFQTNIPDYQASFHRYALSLAQGLNPVQPTHDQLFNNDPDLTHTLDATTATFTISIPIQPMTIQFHKIVLQNLGENKNVTLAYNPNDTTARLSLDTGVELRSLEPFSICAPSATLYLVQTETDAGGGSPELSLNISNCVPEAPPVIEECFIGHWVLDISDGFGPVGGPKSKVLWGGYTIDITSSGLINAVMSLDMLNTQISPPLNINVRWEALVQARVIRNGEPVRSTPIRVTDMRFYSTMFTNIVPVTASSVGALNLNCSETILTMTDPISGVTFRFFRR